MIRETKEQKGITLISLVITIIILLILATVAIGLAVDSDGIFGKAGTAANKWNTSVAEEKSTLDDLIGKLDNYDGEIDWEAILEDAAANPEKYKHPEQSATNGDIGIGTDGKPVNMDLWTYVDMRELKIEIEGYALKGLTGCGDVPSYQNKDIKNGKIKGTVPQYIMEKDGTIKPVVYMFGTFANCVDLVEAPVIPDTVVGMMSTFLYCEKLTVAPVIPNSVQTIGYTFSGCTSLTTAPVIPDGILIMSYAYEDCTNLVNVPAIPSSVINIDRTFYGCTNLTGTLEINANPISYNDCFTNASTAEGTSLVVTGSSTKLDAIIATKSETSNITKGTTE